LGRIAVLVINDLVTDNRVAKTCDELRANGHEVTLFGRLLPGSLPIERTYDVRRFKLPINRGPLFYLVYNLRLFFGLWTLKPDGIYVNDVDTGLAALLYRSILAIRRNARGAAKHWVSRKTSGAFEKIPIVYDAHELFTEVPELSGRAAVRWVWSFLERRLVRASSARITVSNAIAVELEARYTAPFNVVRNIPPPIPDEVCSPLPSALLHGPYAILQGAGINVDRGGEELVLAMQYVDELKLLVVGDGDALPAMKQMVAAKGLEQKVVFLPRMPKAELMGYTRRAVLGFAIDKVTNLNYRYALPNKLFDFIQAGVPVIHADGEEIAAVVNQFGIGLPIESHQPEHIAKAISDAWSDQTRYAQWKENLKKAAESLTWSREKIILEKAIRDAF